MIYGLFTAGVCYFKKSLFIKSKGFGIKPTIAGDYKLWSKFAKYSNLETYNIKIGRFRTWPGQDSQLRSKSIINILILNLNLSVLDLSGC